MKRNAWIEMLIAFSFSSSSIALDLSEKTLNFALASTFPRDIKKFHVQNPKLELKDGSAVFCAIAQPKLIEKNMYFCTTFIPQWHPETGSLHASNMSLTKFVIDGVPEKVADSAKLSINQLVLPRLDGMQIYQTKSWIGKKVSSVKVATGKVSISF